MPKIPNDVQTITIDNFTGSLTRRVDGQLNSGMAKFDTSFGYDPFSKPGNLTWFEQPSSIAGISDFIVDAKPRFEGSTNTEYIYALGNTGKLYKVQPNAVGTPNTDSVIAIASVIGGATSNTYNYGGSLEFYSGSSVLYAGGDKGVAKLNFSETLISYTDTFIGNVNNYTANRYRPLVQFVGYLLFGNGNNIGAIDSTNTVISSVISSHYEQLSPTLPQDINVTDLDVSPDGTYINITASGVINENIATVSNDRQAAAASKGAVYFWNGVDRGVTAYKTIPSYAVTAMQTYLDNNHFFENDAFGASISNGSKKIISLPNIKSPFANATTTNGNFLSWISPEVSSSSIFGSLFYYGQLDQENPQGLWRVMRYSTPLSNGFVYQTPVNLMTNNKYSTVNNSVSSIAQLGYGKHYFSTYDINSGTSATDKFTLQRFLVTSTGTGLPQLGVYETQTQLWSKKINIKQIRIYTEPTVSGNGFQLDCVSSAGTVVTNGTFNYTFTSGGDTTLQQGSLERITFNPAMNDLYAMSIRITNTGTTNMTIKKVEVDWTPSGK